MTLDFAVLGPTAASRDGVAVELGSPQQSALATLLVLHRNEVVSTDRIVEALWPQTPPANAVQVVRTYVSRLRSGPLGDGCVVTQHGGYELRVSAERVDADRFEALAASGRRRLDAGAAGAAESLLREAIALVRGIPFADLGDDDRARWERHRLLELHDIAREELCEARLAQGQHAELVAELRALVDEGPLRERPWCQLMVALYRCGRHAEALGAYRDAHRALAAAGLRPGPRLRAMERMVLLHDPALALASPPPPPRRPGTSFVGRQLELSELAARLRSARLITVTGPAGVGKTRLAAEAVAQAQTRWWWVDLGSLGAGSVAAAVARTLNVPEVPGRTRADLAAAALHAAPGLLVLDNCEHLLREIAGLAARWLAEAPAARLLCTSREPLGVDDEDVVRLDGLAAPPQGGRLTDYAGTRLLLDRAPHAPADDAAMASIVRRLDGLPLAIELAAAKLRILTPAALADALRERLSLLATPDDPGPRRQRSLEAAIAWSVALLPAEHQAVLRRLAVFAGSFGAAQAEAVAGPLETLSALAEASLVAIEREPDVTRYRLLETVRAFARGRLREAGEEDATVLRHGQAYGALAERIADQMVGSGLATWLERARRDHDNLHAALDAAFVRGDGEDALRLAANLGPYWFRAGLLIQGRELLERALRLAEPASRWRSKALFARALLAHASPDALAAADDGVAASEGVGDLEQLALALEFRAHALLVMAGRLDEAAADIERALLIAADAASGEALAFGEQVAGMIAHRRGKLEEAERLLTRSRDRFRRMRGTLDAGYTLVELARVALDQGRRAVAAENAQQALADFRRRDDPRGIAAALLLLGRAGSPEPDRAAALLGEARDMARHWGFIATAQEAERALEAATGRPAHAAPSLP